MTEIVLASGSPRREELLAAIAPAFQVAVSDIPEPFSGDAERDAVELAAAKALTVARANPSAVVIGADTIVYDELRLYGKPVDADDAMAMLARLQGRGHRVATGVAVAADGLVRTGLSISEVTLSTLAYDAIRGYVASGRPLDKAGAYAIQDEDVPTVAQLDGCYCGVMGLPLWLTRRLLAEAGVPCGQPDAVYARCAFCPKRDESAT